MDDPIAVEIVVAFPATAIRRQVSLRPGATVAEAIEASGIERELGVVVDRSRLGVFSRRVTDDQPLADGDRIELYRPLVLDPMEARRRRARD